MEKNDENEAFITAHSLRENQLPREHKDLNSIPLAPF